MNASFARWNEVARRLNEMALPTSAGASILNYGQRASLAAIADRIADNGVVIADEVGMGKTRIAAFVAKAVIESGGRCAVLIPPGLGFQWQAEFRTCGTDVLEVIRSMDGYFKAWDGDDAEPAPWFQQPVVVVSHRFSDWRLGQNPQTWRWCLLPEVYAAARQLTEGRLPRFYREYASDYSYDAKVQRASAAARSMTQAVSQKAGNPARRLLADLLSDVRWPEPLYPQNYGRHEVLRDWLERVVGLGLGIFDLIIVDEAHKNRGDDGGLTRVLDKACSRQPIAAASPSPRHPSNSTSTSGRRR